MSRRDDEDALNDRPIKRHRKEDGVDPTHPDPSKVVHVRNLNRGATEADLLEALSPFGAISYACCMPNKHMALVEFEDLSSAKSCIEFSQSNQIYVAGESALYNYSTSKFIQRLGLEVETPNLVVILTVYNAHYPINTNTIYQICQPHGAVLRIALLKKQQLLQALVEFDTVDAAKRAKAALNGADIYSGCCTIKIEFARPEHVRINPSDPDQRDYTLTGPPSASDFIDQNQQPMADNGRRGYPPMGQSNGGGYGYGGGGGGGGDGYGGFGYDRSGYSGASYDQNSYEQRNYDQGGYDQEGYDQNVFASGMMGPPGRGSRGSYSSHMPMRGMPMGARGRGRGHGFIPHYDGTESSCVVMVYGVNEQMNCDRLFNLLCLYGNVLRMKFMKSKPDTVMVQMANPAQVRCTIDNLFDALVFGQKLSLKPSKQPVLHEIRDPFDLPDGSTSYKDYAHSRNNRYSTPDAVARNRIMPPTSCLHFYNSPPNMTVERMTELLSANDAKPPQNVIIFQAKTDRSSSGIAEFETTEDAIDSLIKNNHTPVESPTGKIPYIMKLAFAAERKGTRSSQNYGQY